MLEVFLVWNAAVFARLFICPAHFILLLSVDELGVFGGYVESRVLFFDFAGVFTALSSFISACTFVLRHAFHLVIIRKFMLVLEAMIGASTVA